MHLREVMKYANIGFNMQICYIPLVKFKIYKSNKSGGWVGLAEGRGNIHVQLEQ